MGLEDLGAFDDEWNIGVSLSHRALPKLRGSNQDRQRSTFSIDIAIGEEEEPRALAITQRGSQALSETTARSRDSSIGRKACINNLQLRDCCTERRKLGGAKNGAGQAERLAKRNFEGHHVGFAQRIDGRIGNLRAAGEKEFCTGRRSSRTRLRDAWVRRSTGAEHRRRGGGARGRMSSCAEPAW